MLPPSLPSPSRGEGRMAGLVISPSPLEGEGWGGGAASPRQVGAAHEEFVDGARALAAFADGPHDQRLAAPDVAGGKHAGHRGRVIALRGLDVAARIEGHAHSL